MLCIVLFEGMVFNLLTFYKFATANTYPMKKFLLTPLFVVLCAVVVSAQVRYRDSLFTTVQVDSNILYGNNITVLGASQDLMLDFYYPAGDTVSNRPVVLVAHGGSFINGDRKLGDVVELCNQFAKRGYVAVSMQYRLGINPFSGLGFETEFTRAVWRGQQDGRAAVRFLRKHAATSNTYRINPDQIFFAGVSAGGVLGLQMIFMDLPSEIAGLSIDTVSLGGFEGNSGNAGYSSRVKAIANLAGALKNVTWMYNNKLIPICHVHGDSDQTVPYKSADYYYQGFKVSFLQGSFSIDSAAKLNNMYSELHTFKGQDHVPFSFNSTYMDSTVRFVSTFFHGVLNGNINASVVSATEQLKANVYPNPAADLVKITFPVSLLQASVSITDLNGKTVLETTCSGNEKEIDIHGLANGLYIIKTRTSNQVSINRLVITR